MRRKDKEIKDQGLISHVIKNSEICRLGLAKDNEPFVIPISFGYDGEAIYFHTAWEGKKIDYISANNAVCCGTVDSLIRDFDDMIISV